MNSSELREAFDAFFQEFDLAQWLKSDLLYIVDDAVNSLIIAENRIMDLEDARDYVKREIIRLGDFNGSKSHK